MSMRQHDLQVSSRAAEAQTPNRRPDCIDQNMISESEAGKEYQE